MSTLLGRYLPLSLPRRFLGDLAHFALRTPTATLERHMRLAPLVAAHVVAEPQLRWEAVFLKAFAVVASRRRELRQACLPFPWSRLYEHPVNVTAVGIEHRCGDEDVCFFHLIHVPERRSLLELDDQLQQMSECPIENLSACRRLLWLSSLPRPLRRLIWWLGLNVSGAWRARYLGTQAMMTLAGHGCAYRRLLSPWTSALSYGPLERDGTAAVSLTFDQRVLDGVTAAQALEEMERVLLGEIVNELRYLEAVQAA